MKLFKRGICSILAILMAVSLAACSDKAVDSQKTDTLTWFIPTSNQPDAASVLEQLSAITQEKIGASLQIQFVDSSAYSERMTMNMASGNDFDLCFAGYVNPYISAVQNYGLMAIDGLMSEYTPKLLESIPDYAWEIAKVDGKIYAVPNLQGFAPPSSLHFVDELTEKYSFDTDTIKHVEDVEPFLETIKANEPNLIPYRTNFSTNMWTDGIYEEITSGLVIRCDGSSPEVMLLYDTPEYKRAIEVMHKWYEKGYIRSDLVSVGSDTQDYNAGKYAVSNGGWLPGAEDSTSITLGKSVSIVPIMKPYMSKNKSLAAMTAISATSKKPEKAIKLIELVNTDKELFNLLAFGIEGKHYTLNEAGKVKFIENGGYMPNRAWLFGNQFNALLTEGQEDDVWEQTMKLNDEAVRSPILGFVLDTSKIKNEISQIAAVQSEFTYASLVVEGFSNYDELMTKLKSAGIDRLKEEVQNQINAYWEENK